jgi:hypothetical protein
MLGKLQPKYNRLLLKVGHRHFNSEQAAEYARHGYLRRTGTLKRCIENVFALIPPDEDQIPCRNALFDAQINIQAFFANVYGSIDNLAWMWVYERGLESKIPRNQVGLRAKNKSVRATLSADLHTYLEKLDPWLTEGACSAHVRLPGEFAEAPLGMSPIHVKRTGKSSARQQIDFEFLSVSEAALVVLFVQKS